jgi:hypothetical protein
MNKWSFSVYRFQFAVNGTTASKGAKGTVNPKQ